MIIWTLIGYILQWIGHLAKRSDVLFLGYYLAGTGKTRSLPEYSLSVVNTLIDGIEPENGDKYILNPMDYAHSMGTTMSNEFRMLFQTIGKFWCIAENGIVYIKDRYMFYPLCSESESHFSNCTCTDKKYTRLYKVYYYPPKLRRIASWFIRNVKGIRINSGELLRIRISSVSASIEVNDEFWVNKGKPFDVYHEIPVSML